MNNDSGEGAGKVKVNKLDLDSDDKWVQIGHDLVGEAAGDKAGYSVSLSSDGKVLAIGAPYGDVSGNVRVYHLVGSNDSDVSWVQVGKNIIGDKAGDNAGFSVSLSSNGKVVAVGSPGNDNNGDNSGHVQVFSVDDIDV